MPTSISWCCTPSSTPRQPGGRNWLWQKVQVKGLDQALGQPRMADFLNALAGPKARFLVSASPSGSMRTLLDIKPATNIPEGPLTRPIGDVFSEMVSDLTGRVVTAGRAGQRAQRRAPAGARPARSCPAIPSGLQIGYLALHRARPDRLPGVAGAGGGACGRRRWPASMPGASGLLGRPHRARRRVPARVPARDSASRGALHHRAPGRRYGDDAGAPVALAHGAAPQLRRALAELWLFTVASHAPRRIASVHREAASHRCSVRHPACRPVSGSWCGRG